MLEELHGPSLAEAGKAARGWEWVVRQITKAMILRPAFGGHEMFPEVPIC